MVSVWGEWTTASASTASTTSGSSEMIWYNWNDSGTSNCTATSSSTDSTWISWVSDTTDSTGFVTYTQDAQGTVWTKWNETYKVVERKPLEVKKRTRVQRPIPRVSTELQRARRVQRELMAEWHTYKYECLKREKEEAEERALELLADIIGEDQMLIYKETGRLVVHGEKNDWLLRKNLSVIKLSEKEARSLCVHIKDRHSYPDTDNIISLALHLKHNEAEVDEEANHNSTVKSEHVKKGEEAKVINYEEIVKKLDNKRELVEELIAASF